MANEQVNKKFRGTNELPECFVISTEAKCVAPRYPSVVTKNPAPSPGSFFCRVSGSLAALHRILQPRVDFALGLVLGVAIAPLEVTTSRSPFVSLPPLLLDLAFEFRPIAFHAIPIHFATSPSGVPMASRKRLLRLMVAHVFRDFGQRRIRILFFLKRLFEKADGILQTKLVRPGAQGPVS
jgi:hypothetical protein